MSVPTSLAGGEPIGIEIDEHHDTERAGADRGQRDQKAEQRAGRNGESRLGALEAVGLRRAQFLAGDGARAEQHASGQRARRRAPQQQGASLSFLGEKVQQGERQHCAADFRRAAADQPVDRATCAVHPATEALGDGREQRSVPMPSRRNPDRNTSSGVISAPPPTPVKPTSTPTRNLGRGSAVPTGVFTYHGSSTGTSIPRADLTKPLSSVRRRVTLEFTAMAMCSASPLRSPLFRSCK